MSACPVECGAYSSGAVNPAKAGNIFQSFKVIEVKKIISTGSLH
jgi:hypothetical protein